MTVETTVDPDRRVIETALSGADGLRAYVLVDGAMLQTRSDVEREHWPTFLGLSLLANADVPTQAVGPLLFESRPKDEIQDDALTSADDTGIVWAASSVIVSALTLEALAAHLAPMLDVQLEQMENTMLMRFFDPRVLPFWLDMLPAEHLAWLARGVRSWIYLDIHQNLHAARIEEPAKTDKIVRFPLQISQQQEDDLLAACYPYTMIERLRSEFAPLMERVPEARQYDFVRDQLDRCRARGADSPASLLTWCELALRYGPHFDEHPAMQPVFASLDDGQTFTQALTLVPSGDWTRMQAEAAN